MGCKPPPPAPWMAKAQSNAAKLGATPQRSEATVNRAMQLMKKRLRPTALEIQLVIGKTMALAMR
jgi:hypothetical protein